MASIPLVHKLQHFVNNTARVKVTFALLFLTLPFSLLAQQQGVQIVLVNGYSLMNVFVDSLQGDTVFLAAGGNTLSESVDSIVSVTSLCPGGGLKTLFIGAFAGAAVGFMVGEIIDKKNER